MLPLLNHQKQVVKATVALSRGLAAPQLAQAPAATGSKAPSTITCPSSGWHRTVNIEKHPPVCSFARPKTGRDEGGLLWRPADQLLDSHVLLHLPFLPSPLDSTTHGIYSAGSPLPWCLSSPQFMHLRELAGRSSHLQGSLPRRCDQDHLPRSVRFGCYAERLCDRRRPRLRQPVAALTSAPRPKTRSFLFFPCLVRVQQPLSRPPPPRARPHLCSLPTARIRDQRQWKNGWAKWNARCGTWTSPPPPLSG